MEVFERLLEDGDTLTNLFLVDSEWRCKADDVTMCWLGEQTQTLEFQAKVPPIAFFCMDPRNKGVNLLQLDTPKVSKIAKHLRVATANAVFDDHSIQETTAANK